MANIPIEIEKIRKIHARTQSNDSEDAGVIEYLITVTEKGQSWSKTFRCGLKELTKLRDHITELIDTTTTAEKLNISNSKAKTLEQHYREDPLCENCKYQLTHSCLTCLFKLQSPLERKLFLALKNNYIRFETQLPLNWKGQNISLEGKSYHNPQNNFKDVLTVVDFYIKTKDVQICIYTDGHTYHERSEEQAQRDKKIDRKLQELGFQVLRFTGKDINENMENTIDEIKKWLQKHSTKVF